jgi:putative membrane protein
VSGHHEEAGVALGALLVVLVALLALVGYLGAVAAAHPVRAWPRLRSTAWVGGVLAVLGGTVGPLATAAHTDFTAHAVTHLLVGMLGPLLLVCGAPATVALRALPVPQARRLSRLLAGRPLSWLSEPVVAAVLSVGGLALLYLTPLYGWAQRDPVLHLLVHAHLLVAGYLLTASLVGADPMPHRRSFPHRAVVLVAAAAGHAILTKHLYAYPPDGVTTGAAQAGALVMYYGGDVVELALAALLCSRWFARPRWRTVAPA